MMHPDESLLETDATEYALVKEIVANKEEVNNNGYGRAKVAYDLTMGKTKSLLTTPIILIGTYLLLCRVFMMNLLPHKNPHYGLC